MYFEILDSLWGVADQTSDALCDAETVCECERVASIVQCDIHDLSASLTPNRFM